MIRYLPLAACLLFAAGVVAEARTPVRPPPPPTVDVGAELGAAIRAKNAARVGKLLGDSVQNYGVWFTDAACAKQFGTPRLVTGNEVQAFARCLSQLKLQATTRQPGAADNAILTYDPGVELEIVHTGGRVRWIGFEYQTAGNAGRPTLTAQAFEALRAAGKSNLDDAVSAKLEPIMERAKAASVSAWLKLCLDEQGDVDQVNVRQSDAPGMAEKVGAAFEIAIQKSWRFRPFEHRGKKMAVCTMALMTYPASRAPLVETLPAALQPTFSADQEGGEEDEEDGEVGGVVGGGPPPPPPPPPPPSAVPQTVPPTLLEGSRISGNKNIVPDAATQAAIAKSGKGKIVGSWKLCLDAKGAISAISQLKSTGFPAYDAKIESEMKQWVYKPFLVNGKAGPVCTAVTFIYAQPGATSQPPAPPPPPPPPPKKKP